MAKNTPKTPMKYEDLSEHKKRLLKCYPMKTGVKWEKEGDFAVITYEKNFRPLEGWIHRRIGGPGDIRRPLDEKGTRIWDMCDGEHTVIDICTEMDNIYKEDMEPVMKRVLGFLEILLFRGLIRLEEKNEKERRKDEEEAKN